MSVDKNEFNTRMPMATTKMGHTHEKLISKIACNLFECGRPLSSVIQYENNRKNGTHSLVYERKVSTLADWQSV